MEKESKLSPAIILPLVLIALASGLALAGANVLTRDLIAEAIRRELVEALVVVQPGFDNDPTSEVMEMTEGEAELKLYPARKGEALLGHAVLSKVKTGYGGDFAVVLGVNPQGVITRVRVFESMETPGLGSRASDSTFIDQFEGKSLVDFNFKVKKDGGDVDALTGATITSRAVSLAVGRALEGVKDLSEGASR